MSFDWQQTTKERYWKKVEKMTKAAGLDGFLVVDREKFGIIKDKVKVYFVRIRRDRNTRRWSEAVSSIEGIKEITEKDMSGKKIKGTFINAYVLLDMEKRDR